MPDHAVMGNRPFLGKTGKGFGAVGRSRKSVRKSPQVECGAWLDRRHSGCRFSLRLL